MVNRQALLDYSLMFQNLAFGISALWGLRIVDRYLFEKEKKDLEVGKIIFCRFSSKAKI